MLTWSCEQVRTELSSFHDGELAVTDRIAITDHLDGCASCRLEADDLEMIGEALQASARIEDVAVMPGLSRLQTDSSSAGTQRSAPSRAAPSAICSTIRAAHRPA